jgi:hypothetical protein
MSFSDFPYSPKVINNYLWEVMKSVEPALQKEYKDIVPFFPLSDAASGNKSWENKPYVIYDRMMKNTNSPFYPIKNDHILYALKANEIKTIEWGNAIYHILDRQDDIAQDINEWNRNLSVPHKIYFHSLRVFQSDSSESRDFSNRPYYITQFIINAEYHITETVESFL